MIRRAGANFLELDEGEALQPAAMMVFCYGPVDFGRFDAPQPVEIDALARRGYEQGELARAALHATRTRREHDPARERCTFAGINAASRFWTSSTGLSATSSGRRARPAWPRNIANIGKLDRSDS